MEQFSNPDLIAGLSLGDKLLSSGLVMVLGMGITFMVLVGLMVFIALLKNVAGHKKAVEKAEAVSAEPIQVAEQSVHALPQGDDELLAVIAAAIQAQDDELVAVMAAVVAMLGSELSPLKIHSITRLNHTMPTWAQSGLHKNMQRI